MSSQNYESRVVSNPFNVLVTRIDRALRDQSFPIEIDDGCAVDIFELTVQSDSQRTKVLLHPSNNELIYRGLMVVNSVISVCKHYLLSKAVGLLTENIINVFVDVHVSSFNSSLSNEIPVLLCVASLHPVTTARGCYLPLYNDEDYCGDVWYAHEIDQISESDLSNIQAVSVSHLEDLAFSIPTICKPVTGVVVDKSRLCYFGKKNDCRAEYPYMFCIEIADENTFCTVSFWNAVCCKYFSRINLGDKILVSNYRFKRRYSKASNTTFSTAKPASVELSLNVANPSGQVAMIQSCLRKDAVLFRFISCSSLCNFRSTECVFDIVGVVSFVGRVQREKKQIAKMPYTCGSFWMYRWIRIHDGTFENGIFVKIYACSQPDVISSLAVGSIFVGLRFMVVVLPKPPGQCHKFVSTTRQSQLFTVSPTISVEELRRFIWWKEKEVLDLFMWSREERCQQLIKNGRSGGYFSFPPLPPSLGLYKMCLEEPLQLVSFDDLLVIYERDLHYMQTYRACVLAGLGVTELLVSCEGHAPTEESKSLYARLELQSPSGLGGSTDSVDSATARAGLHFHRTLCPISVTKREQIAIVGYLGSVAGVPVSDPDGVRMTEGLDAHTLQFLLLDQDERALVSCSFIARVGASKEKEEWDAFSILATGVIPGSAFSDPGSFLDQLAVSLKGAENAFVCVVDLYNNGGGNIEIVLTRAYRPC